MASDYTLTIGNLDIVPFISQIVADSGIEKYRSKWRQAHYDCTEK